MSILFINACVREDSRTLTLARRLLCRLGEDVTELCLNDMGLMPLTRERLAERDGALHRGDYGADILKYGRQFAEAETVVMAAPFWDFSVPTLLKCYIENITATGVTFDYAENGYRGLCKAEKLYFVTTAGGSRDPDFGFTYIDTLAKQFYGIPETVCFAAEGLDMVGADIDSIMAEAIAKIDGYEV